jgi:hypothetical protein
VAVAAVGPGAGALAPPSASAGIRVRLGWTLAGASLLLAVAGIVLAVWWSVPLDAVAPILALTMPVVGGLVVSRRPRTAVGWVLLAIGAAEAELVKPFETRGGQALCMSASGVGWLIQATVGSFGAVGVRPQNRSGWAA